MQTFFGCFDLFDTTLGNFLPCLCSNRLNSSEHFAFGFACDCWSHWTCRTELPKLREVWVWFIGGVFSHCFGAYCLLSLSCFVKITSAAALSQTFGRKRVEHHETYTICMFSDVFFFFIILFIHPGSGQVLLVLDFWPPCTAAWTGAATGTCINWSSCLCLRLFPCRG